MFNSPVTINCFFQNPRYFIFILIQEYVDISISFRRRYLVLPTVPSIAVRCNER
jgi:hypothetical protein